MDEAGGRIRAGVRVLALLALVALAGCGAVASGGEATPTVTPAPVPEPAFPDNELRWDERVDGQAIVERHQAAIRETSFSLVETFRVGPPENASYDQHIHVLTAAGNEPYYMRERTRAKYPSVPARNESIWWNGEIATYRHVHTANRSTTFAVPEDPSPRWRLGGQTAVLLDSLSITSVERGPNDTTIVAGVIERTGLLPVVDGIQDARNATMTIRVRPEGIVDRVAIGYDARYYDEARTRVRYTYSVTDVGTTTLELPGWVAAYRNGAANSGASEGSRSR